MVEQVTGFLANDNKFFPTKAECEAYEAQIQLLQALTELGVRQPATAFSLINRCAEEILRYLNALGELPARATPQADKESDDDEIEYGEASGSDEPEDDDPFSEGVVGDAEEDTEAVQSLPPGVRQPVPDLGRHIQPTQIRHERKINGPRGRQPDARDIRDGESVATTPRRRPPKAR